MPRENRAGQVVKPSTATATDAGTGGKPPSYRGRSYRGRSWQRAYLGNADNRRHLDSANHAPSRSTSPHL